MKELIEKKIKRCLSYIKTLFKWISCSIIIGIACGVIGTLFHFCVDFATQIRERYNWLIYFLPLAGILIVYLYKIAGMGEDRGTNLVFSSIRSSEKIPARMAPLTFIGTTLTHLCGGSSGREGAALQIGGSVGAFIGRTIHLEKEDIHIITMCGMSGVFSALFGTPLTATIFSMEVISVGVFYYIALVPCLISSIIAFGIAKVCGIAPVAFNLKNIPPLSVINSGKIMILAACCAICSILFCISMHTAVKIYKLKIESKYLRIIISALLVIGLTLLVGCQDYNGAGMDIVTKAIEQGQAKPEAFFLKIIFTAVTLGAGFKGGEIVPTFFIGSTFGNLIARGLGLYPGFGAAIGLVSLFCGVVNCPMAALMLSIELFGSKAVTLFGLACGVAYILSGYYSLYASQKIVYSKLHPKYVNKNTK